MSRIELPSGLYELSPKIRQQWAVAQQRTRSFFQSIPTTWGDPRIRVLNWIEGTPRVVAAWLSTVVDLAASAFSFFLVIGLFLVHLRAALSSQQFTQFSLVEETAYTLTSALNYLKFGFLNSDFLQDFTASMDPADHPYVYDHMPPGPDITQAVLLGLTGGSYEASRIIFSLMALIGFVIYYLFARKFLARFGLRGAGITLLLANPWVIVQLYERQIYSPFCILCFTPLYLYLCFLEDGRKWRLFAAAFIAFLSSLYLEYTVLAAISACWFGFFATRLIPIRIPHFVLIAASIATGVGLHLVQNLVYLGWTNFALELTNTLSNRMTGYPSLEALQTFYRSIGILHHGAHPIKSNALLAQLKWNFDFLGAGQLEGALLASLVIVFCSWMLTSRGTRDSQLSNFAMRYDLSFFLRLGIWIVCTVMASMIMFPAFSQEVTIRGSIGSFFLAIVVAAIFDYSVRLTGAQTVHLAQVIHSPNTTEYSKPDKARDPLAALSTATIFAIYVLALCGAIGATVKFAAINKTYVTQSFRSAIAPPPASVPSYDQISEIDRFSGQLFMTNINVPTVALFTKFVGFGVCSPESIKKDGGIALSECKIAMTRRYDYWSSMRPRYFFYFEDSRLFPGFADCLPTNSFVGQDRREASCMQDLLDRLSSQYKLIMKNDLIKVFDLSLPTAANTQ
jgi:hypothetical protein